MQRREGPFGRVLTTVTKHKHKLMSRKEDEEGNTQNRGDAEINVRKRNNIKFTYGTNNWLQREQRFSVKF
jgi:hypothetical protein